MLLSAMVMGHASRVVMTAPQRKSFHTAVNCQMRATAKAGRARGSAMSK